MEGPFSGNINSGGTDSLHCIGIKQQLCQFSGVPAESGTEKYRKKKLIFFVCFWRFCLFVCLGVFICLFVVCLFVFECHLYKTISWILVVLKTINIDKESLLACLTGTLFDVPMFKYSPRAWQAAVSSYISVRVGFVCKHSQGMIQFCL